MSLRAKRSGRRKAERQHRKMPNQTTDSSKCHTQTSTDRTRARASPFQKQPRTHDLLCAAPSSGQHVSFAGLQTTESGLLSATVWLVLSCRSIDTFQKRGVAVHDWVLVKRRNTNHTTSLLARPFVLKVQHDENATQNTQSRRRKQN